jgi:hypothetical protein
MRAVVGILYWVLVGFLALNALYVSYGENRLWSGLLIPAALALVGAWWPGLRYSGAGLVVVGAYPALFITRALYCFRSSARTGPVRRWPSTASPTPTEGMLSGCPLAAPLSPST